MEKRSKALNSTPETARIYIGRVNIEPHGFGRLHAGIYEGGFPAPEFIIEAEPEIGDELSAKLERSDDADDYTLEYFFQNFSGQSCSVTVWAKGGNYANSNVA